MERHLSYMITEREDGLKIEEFLRASGCSHHVLTHLKRTERGIVLNGEWAYASQRMKSGDNLTIHLIETEGSEQIVPVNLPLSILYEDEDLMVINKAPDMPIHPSVNNHENTLANAVMYYFASQQIPFVYRCINRLDRDTSGLLILAKNMMSGALLSQMSAARQIHREYLAVAEGLTPPSGTIDAPIARKEESAIMRCVDFERGERALTHYERIAHKNALSLLRIHLETGRTHQIRVHMHSIGHPLAGDFLYNPDSQTPISRQALHSHALEFVHPVTKKEMHFTCEMPEDMKALL